MTQRKEKRELTKQWKPMKRTPLPVTLGEFNNLHPPVQNITNSIMRSGTLDQTGASISYC